MAWPGDRGFEPYPDLTTLLLCILSLNYRLLLKRVLSFLAGGGLEIGERQDCSEYGLPQCLLLYRLSYSSSRDALTGFEPAT